MILEQKKNDREKQQVAITQVWDPFWDNKQIQYHHEILLKYRDLIEIHGENEKTKKKKQSEIGKRKTKKTPSFTPNIYLHLKPANSPGRSKSFVMEDWRHDAGTPPAASGESQSAELGSTRRRAALKRKASALNLSNSFLTPSKRATREKSSSPITQIHNGPLTRARQAPSNLGPGASSASHASTAKIEEKVPVVPQEVLEAEAERKAIEEWEALEASVEAEFGALRSRDPNDHVVPNHCGKWLFSGRISQLRVRFYCFLLLKSMIC